MWEITCLQLVSSSPHSSCLRSFSLSLMLVMLAILVLLVGLLALLLFGASEVRWLLLLAALLVV